MTEEQLQIAKEMGFTVWYEQEPVKGWHADLMGGKSQRRKNIEDALKAQEDAQKAIEERLEEIRILEEQVEVQAAEEANGEATEEQAIMEEIEQALAEDEPRDPSLWNAIDDMGTPIRTGRLHDHIAVKVMTEGKKPKTTIINCCDCNAEREIKVQDAFQVTRCVACQKKHRNKVRAARKKEQRNNLTVDDFRALAVEYYNKGGDTVVECWDDEDIQRFIDENKGNVKAAAKKLFKDLKDRREDIQATAF